MHLLPLLSFFLGLTARGHADVAQCSFGDTEYDGYCYQFVNQRVLFPDAQAYCAARGASIVRIRGAGDSRWIAATAATEFHATYGNFWIGLHREEDEFVWEDHQKPDFLNWASGYPFSGYDYVGAQLSSSKWVSVPSSQSLPFICAVPKGANHKQPTTPAVTQAARGVCDGADLLLGHRCYFFNPSRVSVGQARETCAASGKTLAIFDDISQINFVTSTAISKFSMSYGTFWIGLEKNSEDGKFYWADGKEDSLKYWIPGFPFERQTVVSQLVSTGKWKTSGDTELLPFVCSGYIR